MSDRPKALVILTPAFAASETESWLPSQEGLVKAMNRNFPKLKIVILSFHFPRPRITYQWHSNKVIAFGAGMKGKLHSVLLWRQVWKQLFVLNQQYSLLGVFSFFCSESAFIGHYFAKRYNLKHHIWVLGQDAKAENKQVRRIRPTADELICISDFLVREFHKNHGVKPAHIIPIGIDEQEFNLTSVKRDIDILAAGALIPLKQYDVFVDVVNLIRKELPEIQAMHCGDGPEAGKLLSKMNDLGLAQRLIMAGKKSHPDLLNIMQRSRIFLHTSAYEGMGAVCLEALYAGAQVISFCKPVDASITHWHVVSSAGEMAALAIHLLQESQPDYTPIAPFTATKAAADILALYDCKEAIIS